MSLLMKRNIQTNPLPHNSIFQVNHKRVTGKQMIATLTAEITLGGIKSYLSPGYMFS